MDPALKTNKDLFHQLKKVLPGGVSSPARAFLGLDVDPLVIKRGALDEIWDVENGKYIDYCMSFGALILGHAHPEVVAAGKARLEEGITFGVSTELEGKMAKTLSSAFPSIDQLRFVSSGTEATMTAVRLARAVTRRPIIIKFDGNYHGHADPFLVQAGSGVATARSSGLDPTDHQKEPLSRGLPLSVLSHTLSLPYNNEDMFRKILRDPYYASMVAAVIVEPVAANMGVVPADRGWLDLVSQETKRIGAVLIFDEVISGFRLRFGGAQHDYGIKPDLTCLGKVIGGGMPVAALGGKKEIMEQLAPLGPVYQAGTLSGHPLGLQIGLATLNLAKQEGFYQELAWKAKVITEPVRTEIEQRRLDAVVHQIGGMFAIFWGVREVENFQDVQRVDKRRFGEFFSFLLNQGIYFPPSPYEACFVSSSHTDDHLHRTRDAILDFIETC